MPKYCLCTHRHADYGPCTYRAVNPNWLLNGEGEEFIICKCPKFTLPAVKRR